MLLEALDKDGNTTAKWEVFSVGGGSLAEEGKRNTSAVKETYPLSTMDEIVKWCKDNNKTLVDFALENEDSDIMDHINTIREAMKKSIDEGLATNEVIPGKLHLKRRAGVFY